VPGVLTNRTANGYGNQASDLRHAVFFVVILVHDQFDHGVLVDVKKGPDGEDFLEGEFLHVVHQLGESTRLFTKICSDLCLGDKFENIRKFFDLSVFNLPLDKGISFIPIGHNKEKVL
jgi:hypothetical protein